MSSGLILVVVVLLATAATPVTASATVLELERTLPLTGVRLEQLKLLDKKHLSMKTNVLEYSLGGTPVLYYIRVKLGTPSKEYTLQFDTGSDLVWVSCTPCAGCPTSNDPNIKLENYNPDSSSTSSRISCSDTICAHALETGYAVCQTSEYPEQCGYAQTYGDGSVVSGYYVSDTLYFDKVVGQKRVTSSASIFFGCSNSRSYQMQTDEIIGFGQNAISAISQLNSQRVSGKVFSHCLRASKDGSKDGGGILVLDEVQRPGVVFTPIVPSQDHYNVDMKGIAVNGKNISIDSSLLTTSNTQGTIVDSGTTLAYLADGVYDPVITAMDDIVHAGSINSFVINGSRCYYENISNVSLFPTVTLYFEGGASMTIGPKDYLVPMFHYDGLQAKDPMLCIGFQPSNKGLDNYFQHTTILGDIVLHDKIFIYNLEKKRIGWVNYNCSKLNTNSSFVDNDPSDNPPVTSESSKRRAPSYCSGLIALVAAFIHILRCSNLLIS